MPTDISLSQYLSIQEKGVSAWEFEASYDQQLFVHDRTELSFIDREACVQTNLPLPKQQEVYYWEVKMFEKSPQTTISVGVSTKPFPTTRLPGKKFSDLICNGQKRRKEGRKKNGASGLVGPSPQRSPGMAFYNRVTNAHSSLAVSPRMESSLGGILFSQRSKVLQLSLERIPLWTHLL